MFYEIAESIENDDSISELCDYFYHLASVKPCTEADVLAIFPSVITPAARERLAVYLLQDCYSIYKISKAGL